MEKNEIVTIDITDMSDEGLGIGRTKDGMAVFVKDSVAGDRIRARIVKTKKTYAFGRVEEILASSPHRVPAVCPSARACGGCQIQELSYPAQLRLKERKVKNDIRRIGKIECPEKAFAPIIGMENPFRYRNKAEYPVSADRDGRLTAGFYAGRTHTVIDGRDCVIGIPENRPVLEAVLSWMKTFGISAYDEKTGKGLIRNVMIRCGFSTGQIMAVLVANGDRLPHEKELVSTLRSALTPQAGPEENGRTALPGAAWEESASHDDRAAGETGRGSVPVRRRLTGILLNSNTDRTNVILGRRNRILWGNAFIEDSIGDVRYRISPLSFYQVNPVQTRRLYETVRSFAGLTGSETVWDLYCGIGTISLYLAREARMVYGLEVVPDAVENARANAALNHIDNARFMIGKAEDVLPREYREHSIHADIVVVDPPRKGLDPKVIATILSMNPRRVVYVSCNGSTLARDLAVFSEKSFRVEKVQPVDMFPQTVHVETVVLMSRVKD